MPAQPSIPLTPMPIRRSSRRAWLLAALFAVAAPGMAGAQRQAVTGTRVTLEPPEGFAPAARFTGFGREAARASIAVTELVAPFSVIAGRLTPEAFAAQGMAVRTYDTVAVEGASARLLSLTQNATGGPYGKWVLVFGDERATVLVTATYPADAEASLGEPMKQAVLSARRSRETPADPLEGIGFTVDPGTRLRIASRMGNNLSLNETGSLPMEDKGAPFLVIGQSVAEVDLGDLEAFARRRVANVGSTLQVTGITGGGPVTIGGAAGYELFADARAAEGGAAVKVYQVVLPEGSHYLLLMGFVGAERAAEFIPEFQSIARTLRPAP